MTRRVLAAVGPGTAAGLVIHMLRRKFVIVRVTGTSMLPGIRPGDQVLMRRCGRSRVGSVIVLRPSPCGPAVRGLSRAAGESDNESLMIKRLAAEPGDAVPPSVLAAARGTPIVPAGTLVILADNPSGGDSRHWGFVPAATMLGVVICRIAPQPGRLGPSPGNTEPRDHVRPWPAGCGPAPRQDASA